MSFFNRGSTYEVKSLKANKLNQIKQCTLETCCSTKTHGLPKIVKTKSKMAKSIWIICFLASVSFSIYSVTQTIMNYLKFDVVSLTRTIYEPHSEIPSILLCNKNSIKYKYFNQTEIAEIKNLTKHFNISEIHVNLEHAKKKYYLRMLKNFEDFRIKIQNMLISCRHGLWYCDKRDFEHFFHFTHGGCYMFNSNALKKYHNKSNIEPIKIYRPEFQNSLQLELFIGERNELDIFSSSTGFELILLNSSDFANKLDYLNLAPGFEYNVAIHKTLIEQLPKPYSSCQVDQSNIDSFDLEYVKVFRDLNMTYKQADCIDLCYQFLSNLHCNCTDFILNLAENSTQVCNNDQGIRCILNYKYEIFTKDNYIQENCIPKCPLECKRAELSTTISFSQYPSDSYFEVLKSNKHLQETVFQSQNWSYIKNSILKVNINFETLSYNYIRENMVMSVLDLLFVLGGQLFLFLGISFLSFFEIIEFFIDFYCLLL